MDCDFRIMLRDTGGGSLPRVVKHLLGRGNSFFHRPEGTTQTPIAVVHHAVEIEFVLDDVNMPDAPLLPVKNDQNSLGADGRVSSAFHLNPQDVAAQSQSLSAEKVFKITCSRARKLARYPPAAKMLSRGDRSHNHSDFLGLRLGLP